MLRQNRSFLSVVAGLVIAMSLASCAQAFPSLPVSDDIHIRNGDLGVEFLVCRTGEIHPIYISRVDGEKTETELPAVEAVSVEVGVVYGLGHIVDEAIEPSKLEPMLAGERLNLSFELVDEVDRESPLIIRAVFIVGDEAINGFAEGLWLSPAGGLAQTPCG